MERKKGKTLAEITFVIRNLLNISKYQSVFIFSNNTIVCSTMRIEDLYEKNKDINGILTLYYSAENVFG